MGNKRTHHGDKSVYVRNVRRTPTDLKKLAAVVIALAQAKAEAEAEAQAEKSVEQPKNGGKV